MNKIFTLLLFSICCLNSSVTCQGYDYGQSCDINILPDECNSRKFLQCSVDGVCECRDSPNTFYNLATDSCQLLSGVSCAPLGLQKCVANSKCITNEDGSNRCKCNNNFAPNSERRCFHPYGHPRCTKVPDRCDQAGYQKCTGTVGTTCACNTPATMWYNPRDLQCQLKVNTACHITNTSQPCVPFAQCDPNTRKCLCENDLVGNAEGMCFLSHGTDCDVLNDMCDKDGYLKCANKTDGQYFQAKCACDPEETSKYDIPSRSCRIGAQFACSPEETSQKCVANSICSPTAGDESWKCRCNSDLEPNRNNGCFLPFGKRCEVSDRLCDPAGYLACSEAYNVCLCDLSSHYDNASSTCFKALGQPCSGDSGAQPCVENGFCNSGFCTCKAGFVDDGSKCIGKLGASCGGSSDCGLDDHLVCLQGKCQCQSGYWQEEIKNTVGNGTQIKCVAGWMEICSANDDHCSPAGGLKCLNNQCQCLAPGDQIFQSNIKKCGTKIGGRCHLLSEEEDSNGVLKCVENSECISTNTSEPGYGTCSCIEDWSEKDGLCYDYPFGDGGGTKFIASPGIVNFVFVVVLFLSTANILSF